MRFYFLPPVLSPIENRGFEILQLLMFLRIGCLVLYVGFFFNFSTNESIGEDSDKMRFLRWYGISVFSLLVSGIVAELLRSTTCFILLDFPLLSQIQRNVSLKYSLLVFY